MIFVPASAYFECPYCGHPVHGVFLPGGEGAPKGGHCPDCLRCSAARERGLKNPKK